MARFSTAGNLAGSADVQADVFGDDAAGAGRYSFQDPSGWALLYFAVAVAFLLLISIGLRGSVAS